MTLIALISALAVLVLFFALLAIAAPWRQIRRPEVRNSVMVSGMLYLQGEDA